MATKLLAKLLFLGLAALAGCSRSPEQQPKIDLETDLDSARALSAQSSKPSSAATLDELLLFYPSKYPEGNWKPQGLTYENAWFDAEDGTRLHGWYCPCAKARAVLLYAHGNAGNLSYLTPLLIYFQKELQVSVLVFDYRGYGRSEGVPSVEGVLQDARAARSHLAQLAEVETSQIVLMGRSLGGAVVAQLAGETKPRGLILESTFSSFRDVAEHHYPRLAWLVPESKLNSLAALSRYDGPLLQSHGDADRTVPYDLGLRLFDKVKGPKHFVRISGGDHNDPQSAEYFRSLDRFIADLP
ncbi:MAG TPA: alpha/beta hydrolase [Gemmataceae bacterium]|nr:alpha/beta hydrolase [Gemmataceae bacterium]